MAVKRIHVFRYVGEDGDGLVFTDDEHRAYYECRSNWHYLGTLSEFVKKIKEEVAKKGKVSYWWEG